MTSNSMEKKVSRGRKDFNGKRYASTVAKGGGEGYQGRPDWLLVSIPFQKLEGTGEGRL